MPSTSSSVAPVYANQNATYGYVELDRLRSVIRTGENRTSSSTAWGNRTSHTRGRDSDYGASNRLKAVSGANP